MVTLKTQQNLVNAVSFFIIKELINDTRDFLSP